MRATRRGWAEIAEEARRRIYRRDWSPGDLIPTEAALAVEWGASRGTVNRALQVLAAEGWLDRRRRAGTRVALHPTPPATFAVPLTRDEVERIGRRYGYALRRREVLAPPPGIAQRLEMGAAPGPALHVVALHLADGRPYAHEDRWINPAAAPGILDADVAAVSANEWLLANVPYSGASVSVGAEAAGPEAAEALGCAVGTAILTMDRTTWATAAGVTHVRTTYPPGHRMWSLP